MRELNSAAGRSHAKKFDLGTGSRANASCGDVAVPSAFAYNLRRFSTGRAGDSLDDTCEEPGVCEMQVVGLL
jgi:hypothetical protein